MSRRIVIAPQLRKRLLSWRACGGASSRLRVRLWMSWWTGLTRGRKWLHEAETAIRLLIEAGPAPRSIATVKSAHTATTARHEPCARAESSAGAGGPAGGLAGGLRSAAGAVAGTGAAAVARWRWPQRGRDRRERCSRRPPPPSPAAGASEGAGGPPACCTAWVGSGSRGGVSAGRRPRGRSAVGWWCRAGGSGPRGGSSWLFSLGRCAVVLRPVGRDEATVAIGTAPIQFSRKSVKHHVRACSDRDSRGVDRQVRGC